MKMTNSEIDKIQQELEEDERIIATISKGGLKRLRKDFETTKDERLFCIEIRKAKLEGYELGQKDIIEILHEEIRMERFAYMKGNQGFKEICDEMENDIIKRIKGSLVSPNKNHSPLPNGSTGCREKGVKADGCQLDSDNGSSVDNNLTQSLDNTETKK